MNRQEFEESWPHYSEGAEFSNGDKLKDIGQEKTRGWKTSSILLGIMGYGGLAWAIFGDDPARAAAVMAALAFLYIAYVSHNLTSQATKIRQELEMLKGSIRMNRFLAVRKDDQ